MTWIGCPTCSATAFGSRRSREADGQGARHRRRAAQRGHRRRCRTATARWATRARTPGSSASPAAPSRQRTVRWSGVQPTHRRRGVLPRMMTHQLADIRCRGEPIAVLWASEGRIYQRFGYGWPQSGQRSRSPAARRTSRAGTAAPRGSCARGAHLCRKELRRRVRARLGCPRPGLVQPGRALVDPAPERPRVAPQRVHRVARARPRGRGRVDGYALWRRKPDLEPEGPEQRGDGHRGGGDHPGGVRGDVAFPARHRPDPRPCGTASRPPTSRSGYLVDEPPRWACATSTASGSALVDLPRALARRRYAAPVGRGDRGQRRAAARQRRPLAAAGRHHGRGLRAGRHRPGRPGLRRGGPGRPVPGRCSARARWPRPGGYARCARVRPGRRGPLRLDRAGTALDASELYGQRHGYRAATPAAAAWIGVVRDTDAPALDGPVPTSPAPGEPEPTGRVPTDPARRDPVDQSDEP